MIRITQMLTFFGTISLICITGIASTTDKNLSQTSQCIQPKEYNISLEIQNTNLIVNSTVVLNVSCVQYHIRLQIGSYCNLADTITIEPEDITNIYYFLPVNWKITKLQSSKQRVDSVDIKLVKNEQIHNIVEKPIEIGLYTISSIYSCDLEKVAMVFSTYRNQSETKEFLILPRIPNKWIFPYWENSTTKARFTIQIKHKITDTALSNTPGTFEASSFDTVFSITPPISTHLIAVSVIPNVNKTHTSTEGNVTIRSRFSTLNDTFYAQSLIGNINKLIKKMWNNIIPPSHVYYVLLPINSTYYKSIATYGLVFISEANIIYNEEADSIEKKREVTCLIARNVMQEMFSDWLSTFRPSDFWFIEGFLTVYGVYIHDQFLIKSIVVQTRRNFLDYTEVFSKYGVPIQQNPLIARSSLLRKLWREKAFSTFYMLNNLFGQDLLYTSMFKQAINLYYNTDNTSNNTYNELSILDKFWYWKFEEFFHQNFHFPTEIKRIITSWTTQVGYPVLQVKRYNNTQIVMSVIDCFNVDHKEPCEEKWWIPGIMIEIQNTEVISTAYFTLRSDEKRELDFTSLLHKNQFVIVTNSAGYRVNYDRESWKHIAFFLKNLHLEIADLSDVTLAQLLDDAFYFLVQNRKYEDYVLDENDLDIYLDLAKSLFHVNNSYIAWYPVLIALENMSKIFPFSESDLSKHIKDRFLEILNRFLDDISYTHSSKITVRNQLYNEVLKWTCILGSSKCNDHINGILEWHFKRLAQHNLLPSWQKWIYCQGLLLETVIYDMSDLWQTIFNIYQSKEKEKEFFEFLPCSRQYKNLYGFLFFLKDNSLPIPGKTSETGNLVNAKKSVTVTLLFNMFALHSKNNTALVIILSGLQNGLGRDLNILAILNCIINNIYLPDGLSIITNDNFLNKLLDIYHLEPFVYDAIKEKINNRRKFIYMKEKIHFV